MAGLARGCFEHWPIVEPELAADAAQPLEAQARAEQRRRVENRDGSAEASHEVWNFNSPWGLSIESRDVKSRATPVRPGIFQMMGPHGTGRRF